MGFFFPLMPSLLQKRTSRSGKQEIDVNSLVNTHNMIDLKQQPWRNVYIFVLEACYQLEVNTCYGKKATQSKYNAVFCPQFVVGFVHDIIN